MKKVLIIAFALMFSMGSVDASAQSFLKKLGKAVNSEIQKAKNKRSKKQSVAESEKESEESPSFEDASRESNKSKKKKPNDNIEIEGSLDEKVMIADGSLTGSVAGHQWVDLGLPSGNKWATCNLGAAYPDDFGSYYAWGEIASSLENPTKRNNMEDNKNATDISGNSRYDAASHAWGNGWRMPSRSDFEELMENCVWEWVSAAGRKGFKVTSKVNDNWIFIPTTGLAVRPSTFASTKVFEVAENFNEKGVYWTSTPEYIDWGYTKESYNFHFSTRDGVAGFPRFTSGHRFSCYSIRPVMSE